MADSLLFDAHVEITEALKAVCQFAFTVSGITTVPTQGAIYTNNGNSFTIFSSNAGETKLYAKRTTGSGNPSASGTLTKTSGTGDSTISFSAFLDDGYIYTLPEQGFSYDTIEDLRDEYTDDDIWPKNEIYLDEDSLEPSDNESDEMSASFKVKSYTKARDTSGNEDTLTDSLASRKQMIEFSQDIKKAIRSIYKRQQSGDFVMPEFLLINNLRQDPFSDSTHGFYGVITTFDFVYDLNFTER